MTELLRRKPTIAEQLHAAAEEVETLRENYDELLYAVGNKYPGESRHATALRYIRQAERGDDRACAVSSECTQPPPSQDTHK